MSDFDIVLYGTDTSGRAVFMTKYMRAFWERACAELGFEPTIVQGAFMTRAGGGASDSAGYHDKGGCLDLRTWDRTAAEVEQIIRTMRRLGAAAWRRDSRHGMDPHIHFVLGTDEPLDDGAAYQWRQYVMGRDGLAGNGPDYEWRPSPLVLEPPEDDVTPEDIDKIAAAVEKRLAPVIKAEVERQFGDLFPKRDLDVNLRSAVRELLEESRKRD